MFSYKINTLSINSHSAHVDTYYNEFKLIHVITN